MNKCKRSTILARALNDLSFPMFLNCSKGHILSAEGWLSEEIVLTAVIIVYFSYHALSNTKHGVVIICWTPSKLFYIASTRLLTLGKPAQWSQSRWWPFSLTHSTYSRDIVADAKSAIGVHKRHQPGQKLQVFKRARSLSRIWCNKYYLNK